jgi:AraC-like DNA-binding protein
VAGAAFAIAWTPCIGPTLGAILAAAAMVGYRQPAHFATAFRRRFGVTPARYRMRRRGSGPSGGG